MENEFENICRLLTSEEESNHKLAFQILKGDQQLKEQVLRHFKPILEASNKKTIQSIPKIFNDLIQGKGTMKSRLLIERIPEIHSRIKVLHLPNMGLGQVPKWIKHLNNLESLVLTNNTIKVLPNWIGKLNKLTFLSIADNQIKQIPNTFGNLSSLHTCYIIENEISELPTNIKGLQSLRVFYVKKKNKFSRHAIETIRKQLPNCSIR